MDEILKRDQNFVTVLGGITDDADQDITMLRVDPISKRLLVKATGGGSSGLVIGTTTVTGATNGYFLYNNNGLLGAIAPSGTGTVTSVSVVTANGISGSVATATTTPAITLTLGVITPTSVNGLTLASQAVGFTIAGGTTSKTLTVPLDATVSGTNTGDQTTISGNAGTATALQNSRTLWGQSFDGTGNVSGSLTSVGDITGGASNMTVTSGTGNSRTLIFKTTTSGGVATTAMTLGADQSTTLAGTLVMGSNSITMTGSLGVTGARVTKGWFTDAEFTNTPTIGGTALSSLYLLLSGGTMSGNITLGENASIALDPAGSADGKYTGTTVTAVAGYTQAFGELVYIDPTDSRWEKCDANSAQGADGDSRGVIGMVVVAGTDGNPCTILLNGIIRADTAFPSFTVNNPIYVSETAGVVTQTQPTTADVVIRVVGFAITSDEMYFNPSGDYITHT